jgi:hypothetical protein
VKPSWLPDLLDLAGEWTAIRDSLYEIFRSEIVCGGLSLDGKRVWHDRRVLDGGLEEAFWHLTTRDDAGAGERLHDPRRSERLHWVSEIIRHASDPAVSRWTSSERGRSRTYLWLEEFDFLVVLEERRLAGRRSDSVFFLITAYYVDGDSSRRRLAKRRAESLP